MACAAYDRTLGMPEDPRGSLLKSTSDAGTFFIRSSEYVCACVRYTEGVPSTCQKSVSLFARQGVNMRLVFKNAFDVNV